jgi:hypothetical protein
MGLLKPASNQTAYLKVGALGFEGSGKTYLAKEFAIGMALKGNKKVAWFDTEKGSDFHIETFKKAGIQLDVVKSRAFRDLVATIKEAEQGKYDFLIIDSITHVWRDLVDSYLKSKGRNFLAMKDWGILKTEWAQYTDLYVNSKLSIAMLGRAGHEYDMSEDDDGNQEIKKSGTKMKVETETGFEPDLLIECFKSPKVTVSEKTVKGKKTTKTKLERGFINKCIVVKDRTDTMNGREIEMPKFKDFASVVSFLNFGGEHHGVDTTRDSTEMFDNNGDEKSYYEIKKQKEIAFEELSDLLVKIEASGTSKEAQKKRIEVLEFAFKTSARRAIEDMRLETIRAGIIQIQEKYLPDAHQKQINEAIKEAKESF